MFASTTWRAPLKGVLLTGLLLVSAQAVVHGQQPAGSVQTPQAPAPTANPETALTLTFDQAVDRVVGTSENITIATAGLSRQTRACGRHTARGCPSCWEPRRTTGRSGRSSLASSTRQVLRARRFRRIRPLRLKIA